MSFGFGALVDFQSFVLGFLIGCIFYVIIECPEIGSSSYLFLGDGICFGLGFGSFFFFCRSIGVLIPFISSQ